MDSVNPPNTARIVVEPQVEPQVEPTTTNLAQFYALDVVSNEAITPDAVCMTLRVPAHLQALFSFEAGQYLTLRMTIGGIEQRRAYSICSSPQAYARTQTLSVGIKRVDGGVFSTWAQGVQAGDVLEVMPPQGRFGLMHPTLVAADTTHAADHVHAEPTAHRYLMLASGSGITPILSLIATLLQREPTAHVLLLYGNRTQVSTMFSQALQDLKDSALGRLSLVHVLSREEQDIALLNGRLDQDKVLQLLHGLVGPQWGAQPHASVRAALLCGPADMMQQASAALTAWGMPSERVVMEQFTGGEQGDRKVREQQVPVAANATPTAQATIVLDGKRRVVPIMQPQQTVLEAAIAAGLAMPYSCKGGMCCTCRAHLVQGQVHMLRNYSLSAQEVKDGYVLTCQCIAQTPTVELDFDRR